MLSAPCCWQVPTVLAGHHDSQPRLVGARISSQRRSYRWPRSSGRFWPSSRDERVFQSARSRCSCSQRCIALLQGVAAGSGLQLQAMGVANLARCQVAKRRCHDPCQRTLCQAKRSKDRMNRRQFRKFARLEIVTVPWLTGRVTRRLASGARRWVVTRRRRRRAPSVRSLRSACSHRQHGRRLPARAPEPTPRNVAAIGHKGFGTRLS